MERERGGGRQTETYRETDTQRKRGSYCYQSKYLHLLNGWHFPNCRLLTSHGIIYKYLLITTLKYEPNRVYMLSIVYDSVDKKFTWRVIKQNWSKKWRDVCDFSGIASLYCFIIYLVTMVLHNEREFSYKYMHTVGKACWHAYLSQCYFRIHVVGLRSDLF